LTTEIPVGLFAGPRPAKFPDLHQRGDNLASLRSAWHARALEDDWPQALRVGFPYAGLEGKRVDDLLEIRRLLTARRAKQRKTWLESDLFEELSVK